MTIGHVLVKGRSCATLSTRATSLPNVEEVAIGGPTAPWEARAKIFEQRYPGIKISVVGGFSNVLDKRIDQQFRDHKLEVDAAIFQTLQDFVRWKDEGRLLNYRPDGFDRIDTSFKDPDGAYYGAFRLSPFLTCTTRNKLVQQMYQILRLIS